MFLVLLIQVYPIFFHTLHSDSKFNIGDIPFEVVEVMHHKLKVFAYRIKDLVYITDANSIDDKQLQKIKGCKILIINALRKESHISHFNLQQALDLSKSLNVKQTYLTHISHLMGKHDEVNKTLVSNVQLAFDGLTIDF